jgi:hypothetical protein
MIITHELQAMLDAENVQVAELKRELQSFGDSITKDAERNLRIGLREKYLIDLRLQRYRDGLNPVTGR